MGEQRPENTSQNATEQGDNAGSGFAARTTPPPPPIGSAGPIPPPPGPRSEPAGKDAQGGDGNQGGGQGGCGNHRLHGNP